MTGYTTIFQEFGLRTNFIVKIIRTFAAHMGITPHGFHGCCIVTNIGIIHLPSDPVLNIHCFSEGVN